MADLSITKDVIIIICTLIQTFILGIFSVFGVFWWNLRNRKQDKKKQTRKEEADKQRSDLEKIIAILSENYDEVQEIFHDLKTSVDNLKERTINTGLLTFTEHDVLLYMCHGDNWRTISYNKLHFSSPLCSRKDNSDGREKVMFQVHRIMKFFKDFSFQLSAIDKTCPNDIKSEFSTEIIDMGKTIYPFMTKTRQKLIEKVLIYFGCTIEGLVRYPGHGEIKKAIPYIEYFWYENGEMNCNIPCEYSNVENLKHHVVDRIPEIMRKEDEIQREIRKLWACTKMHHLHFFSGTRSDLLHLIRLIILEIKDEDTNFDTDEKRQQLENFCAYVKKIDCSLVSPEANKRACERKLDDIERYVKDLRTKSGLLKSVETVGFLNSMEESLRIFTTEIFRER
ncbi:Hypothetical predicted protein [Paramuricea clavata]|uniref:Uncharacterized protein n=1 Tax=Paramuricea clavata TaxID=317549 RepID=A0A7D9M5N3_PARCT|nr:Hypothetical predicted protein [Paramuricea clavata]